MGRDIEAAPEKKIDPEMPVIEDPGFNCLQLLSNFVRDLNSRHFNKEKKYHH
jgi:hypothetical protein